jgi:hypothetical protein
MKDPPIKQGNGVNVDILLRDAVDAELMQNLLPVRTSEEQQHYMQDEVRLCEVTPKL